MPKRKFNYDKNSKQWVETTPEDERPLCAELSADAKRFDWGDGVKHKVSTRFPYHSEEMAVSCDPEQMKLDIAKVQAKLARHGVRTDYDTDGRPILRDQGHLNAHAKALGFYSRNAGYRDVTPDNFVESTHSAKAVYAKRQKLHDEIRRRADRLEQEILAGNY